MKLLDSRYALESSMAAFTELAVAGRTRERHTKVWLGCGWVRLATQQSWCEQDREMTRSDEEDRRIFGM